MPFDRRISISLLFGALAAASSLAQAAGTVEVAFLDPAHYSDAGKDPSEARRNEETARQLQASSGLFFDVLARKADSIANAIVV